MFRLLSVVTTGDWGVVSAFAAHAQPLGNSPGTQCHLQHVQDHGRQVKQQDPANPRNSVRSQWHRWGVTNLSRTSWRSWCLEINSLSSYAAEVLIWGISECNLPLFKVVVNDFLLFMFVHCCARPWCNSWEFLLEQCIFLLTLCAEIIVAWSECPLPPSLDPTWQMQPCWEELCSLLEWLCGGLIASIPSGTPQLQCCLHSSR